MHHIGVIMVIATTTIAVATPLLLAALGEVVAEKAGVINVGIEGMMLCGAYAAFAASHYSQSPTIGASGAIAAGLAIAAIFALMTVRFRADQVVAGTALNILALGITGVLTPIASAFTNVPSFHPHRIASISGHAISIDALAIVAVAVTAVVGFYLARTVSGLRLRAVGEYPAAASDSGSNVNMIRVAAILFGGSMAGLAGACLSIGYNVGIGQGISSGRGFIALAVVIVGRWSPIGALLAALLFGLASALQAWYQATNVPIPYQVLLALPYVLTLVALVVRAGRTSAPAALGSNYGD
ncbi:MAG TPA: ABC transporter permease [Capsulimonadaceae bacterium]|jgi:simple sugar transport system permease protein